MPTQQKSPVRRDLLRVAAAAEYLNVSERFIRRLVQRRTVRHYKVGQFVMFDRADLDAYVDQGVRDVARY